MYNVYSMEFLSDKAGVEWVEVPEMGHENRDLAIKMAVFLANKVLTANLKNSKAIIGMSADVWDDGKLVFTVVKRGTIIGRFAVDAV